MKFILKLKDTLHEKREYADVLEQQNFKRFTLGLELNTVAPGGRRKKNRNRKEDSQELIYLMLVLLY